MPLPLQVIQENIKEFEKFKEVWNSKHSEFIRIPDGIRNNILDWHKSSLIVFIDALIEEERKEHDNVDLGDSAEECGFMKAKQETIGRLTTLKEEIQKL